MSDTIYKNLSTIRKQTNASLANIIGQNSRNFEGFYQALFGFFTAIEFNETTNSITVNTIKSNSSVRSDSTIEVGPSGQASKIILTSAGNITSDSLNTSVITSNKLRLTPYAQIQTPGLPGEFVYVATPSNAEGLYYYNSTGGWINVGGATAGGSPDPVDLSSVTFDFTLSNSGTLTANRQISTQSYTLGLAGRVDMTAVLNLVGDGRVVSPLISPVLSLDGQWGGYGGTLTPGSTYYVVVYAVDDFGNLSFTSNELAITVESGKDEIDFSWVLIPGAAFYHVYVGTAPGTYTRFWEAGPTDTYFWFYDYTNQPSSDRAEFPSGVRFATPSTAPFNAGTASAMEISVSKVTLPSATIGSGSRDLSALLDVKGNIKHKGHIFSTPHLLIKSANIAEWDMNDGPNAKLQVDGAIDLKVKNAKAGTHGTLVIENLNALGEINLPYERNYVINNGQAKITPTGVSGAIDMASFYYDGTNFYWNVGYNYTTKFLGD